MSIKYIAIIAALLPFIAANLSYLASAWQGYVDWCIPYIQGCTSISGAGRQGLAFFLFKGLMIPAAVVMAAYWWLSSGWLRQMGDRAVRQHRQIVVLGFIASTGLILYSCVLGSIGDIYRAQRRAGVILYFGLTLLAQLLTTKRVSCLTEPSLRKAYLGQLTICTTMVGLGLIHVGFEIAAPNIEDLDDIFEWNFALLMTFYYYSSYWLWRYRDTRLTLTQNYGNDSLASRSPAQPAQASGNSTVIGSTPGPDDDPEPVESPATGDASTPGTGGDRPLQHAGKPGPGPV